MTNDVELVTMVLAGGKGERLYPLTQDRSKPSVPFGGNFRIIDFTLMNCVMSGLRRIHVLTQYHSVSLSRHIKERWSFLSGELGESIETIPPKLRTPTGFYRGTADAIYRNLDILEARRPDFVLVLSGDHVYRTDYTAFVRKHIDSGADISVLCGETETSSANSFGVTRCDEKGWIREFVEKPADPTPYATRGHCTINLGVYCFTTRFLVQRLVEDAKKKTSHDFGKDILPRSLDCGSVMSCRFSEVSPDSEPYWRDVGSIDSYFECHQDLLDDPAGFDLVDPRLPPNSRLRDLVPTKITTGSKLERGSSLICGGSQIGDANIVRSIISPRVRIGPGATLDRCIIFGDVTIGTGARLRNAIVDRGAVIPPGARVGYGNDSRRFAVSPAGVVVVVEDYEFPEAEGEEVQRRMTRCAETSRESERYTHGAVGV